MGVGYVYPTADVIPTDSPSPILLNQMQLGIRTPYNLMQIVFENRLRTTKLIGPLTVHFTEEATTTCLDVDLAERNFLLCGSSKGSIDIVRLNGFEVERSSESAIPLRFQHKKMVNCCQFYNQDIHLCVTSSQDDTVKLWDLNNQHPVEEYAITHPRQLHWNEIDEANPLIAVCFPSSNVPLIDLRLGSNAHEIRNKVEVTSLRWYPSEKHILATGDVNSSIFYWDIRNSKKPVFNCCSDIGAISAIRFTESGHVLVAFNSNRSTLHFFSVNAQKPSLSVLSMPPSVERIHDIAGRNIAICEDGEYLRVAVPSCSSSIAVVSVDKDLTRHVGTTFLKGHLSKVHACQYRRKNQEFFTTSHGQILRWSSNGERAKHTLRDESKVEAALQDSWSDED